MALLTSLKGVKTKQIFLSFFALSSLFPILIAIFIVNNYIMPIVGKFEKRLPSPMNNK